SIRTRWRFGSKRRLVATIEWLRLLPNDGPFAHTWQTLGMAGEDRAARGGEGVQMAARGERLGSMGAPSQSGTGLLEDTALPDRYRVVQRVARGGMGSVWRADDVLLGREVAIKLLGKQFVDDEQAVRRFQREARTAARLSGHPNVVTTYDVG